MANTLDREQERVEKAATRLLSQQGARTLTYLIEKKLASCPKEKRYIEPEMLVRLLRADTPQPLSPPIREYLCDFLEGHIKKPRGRPKEDRTSLRYLLLILVPDHYDRYLAWLQKRQRRGLEGWSAIRQADWWQGPPHERAARMVARYFGRHIDWRRMLNQIAEIRSGFWPPQ